MSIAETLQLAEHLEELGLYWPALAAALPRDQGPSQGEHVHTSGAVLQAPVNLDVLRATSVLAGEVPATARWCCQILAEPHQARAVADSWPHFPRWHERLLATNAPKHAASVRATVHRWRNLAKHAIGLLVHDRPLGHPCPHHDDPRTELVAPGDEGWLTLQDDQCSATVSWVHVHAVVCRHCDARWTPERYLWLGRLLADAQARRAAQTVTATA